MAGKSRSSGLYRGRYMVVVCCGLENDSLVQLALMIGKQL